MKLSPNVTNVVDIAKAAEDGGADAVSAINTLVGMGIDIKSQKVKLNTVFGGYSGAGIKPVAIANVHKLYKQLSIPIIGIGGICSIEDIIEFFLAGASMVQIGTMNYQNPNLGPQLKGDLEKYLIKQGINGIDELIGKVESYSS